MTKSDIDNDAILAQLSQVLMAPAFQNSVTLSRFFQFIVEQTLAGHELELKEYIIALKVLSKKSDFNPQTDPIVRVHAVRLRRALHEYYLQEGKLDELIISIPKGAYVPVFTKRSGEPGQVVIEKKDEPLSRKKITVAVLPFNNLGSEKSTVAFADGLADHISTELTRYSELAVISYYSCRNIISRVADVKEAGLVLDAKYILTGTVQTDTKRLRIRVQLILAETREQIWAASYERNSTAIQLFEVQDDIVWRVVSETAGHYGAISRNISILPPQTNVNNLEVFNAIFWYYHFVENISEETFHKAENVMFKAVTTEPGYALGWAVLGEILVGGHFMGYKSLCYENQLEQAVLHGKKSLRIDPTCQHAYQTIALANIFLNNKAECLNAIEEWMKIKQGEAGIKGAMGFMLICCGEYDKGYTMLDESVQLNPYYQWWFNAGFSFYHFYNYEYTNAFYWAEKMNIPGVPWELMLKIACCTELNLTEASRKYGKQLMQEFPMLPSVLNASLKAVLKDEVLVDKLILALQKAGIHQV